MFRSRQFVGEANTRLAEGNLSAAAQTAQMARDKSPDFDQACVVWAVTELRGGHRLAALDALRRAVELNPANSRWLLRDRNFDTLRDDPDFKKILGL
jgi:hypothetical protein